MDFVRVEDAWWVRACSDVPALLEWSVVSGSALVARGERLLNGPSGPAPERGALPRESGGGEAPLADRVHLRVPLALVGGEPLHRVLVECATFLG